MIHEGSLKEGFNKETQIEMKVCVCGSVHISFFGRATFHLSPEEFLDFARGVARLSNKLKYDMAQTEVPVVFGNGLSH